MNYGKAIRTVRAAREMSQKELAAKAKLDPSYISLLESGERIPSPNALETLSKALRVPIYLVILLASEKSDLHGIPPKEAGILGEQLLKLLTQAQIEAK